MKRFLRENWLFVVAPIVVVLIAIAVMLVLSNGAHSGTVYDVY
jgi:hypothetical protein